MSMNVKKKSTIGVAIGAVGAAAIALGAGTFASFTATQDGPDTTLAAGTLDFGAPSTVEGNVDSLAPSDTAFKTSTITFTNGSDSDLSGTMRLAFAPDSPLDNDCDGDEVVVDPSCANDGDLGELQNFVKVRVTVQVNGWAPEPLTGGNFVPLSTLTDASSSVAKDKSAVFTLDFQLPQATDNRVQGDSFTLLTTATLEQS